MNYRYSINFLVAVSIVLLSGCQSGESTVGGFLKLDTDIDIEFFVDADINPDDTGQPSPLFIRMYELKADKMLKNADFLDLYERDEEILGADLVLQHKLKRFRPGENRIDEFVLDPDTKFVGLYAEFSNFKQAKYKLIIPVIANNVFRNLVVIRISGNDLIFNEN